MDCIDHINKTGYVFLMSSLWCIRLRLDYGSVCLSGWQLVECRDQNPKIIWSFAESGPEKSSNLPPTLKDLLHYWFEKSFQEDNYEWIMLEGNLTYECWNKEIKRNGCKRHWSVFKYCIVTFYEPFLCALCPASKKNYAHPPLFPTETKRPIDPMP